MRVEFILQLLIFEGLFFLSDFAQCYDTYVSCRGARSDFICYSNCLLKVG